jgi:HSP20 family molecular chaperone IbpA
MNSRKFEILKAFNRARDKNVARRSRTKNAGAQRGANSHAYRVRRISVEKKCREPRHLVDILDGADEIIVVADFAGFNREDLRVLVRGERLIVAAEASDRKYRKCLNLPKRVIPSTMRTTYKNGVLEIRLKKAEEKSLAR